MRKSDTSLGIVNSCMTMALFIVLSAVICAATSTQAETISITYTFERPNISDITIGGETYQRISMAETPNGGQTGRPALPARGARILIPYGSEVERVEVIPGDKIDLGDGYLIEPVSRVFPLSIGPADDGLPVRDAALYASPEPFPQSAYHEVGAGLFRGYAIETLKLRPMVYIPATGELAYYASLTVNVHTVPSGKTSSLFRGRVDDRRELARRIDNTDRIDSYPAFSRPVGTGYDLLIITAPFLADAFLPLKEYHDTTGILTEIRTTTDIGGSSPEAVRDYIRDRYINDGISYVLIGSDDTYLPAPDLYVVCHDVDGDYVEPDMPGDLYFGCLDGTYNYDGDDRWGEPTDGEGGGEIDLIADVYVGRASADFTTEADRFVNKTIAYLNSQAPYLNKVLLAGENLGFSGFGEYGGYSLDHLVDSSGAYGQVTLGIPSSVYSIDRLYERDWYNNEWLGTEVIGRVNNGVHLVNHYGHCNSTWALKIYYASLSGFTNDDYCFIYSQGCLAGHFDNTDCWAEYAGVKNDHGAFALIMNARYGFGDFNADGPAHRFHREFIDAVFNPDEGKLRLGPANHDSREDNLYRIDEPGMRWTYYQLNLFGDPTVALKVYPAMAFDYPGGLPEILTPDAPTSFSVHLSGLSGGVPVPESAQLHYSIDGGIEVVVPLTVTAADTYAAELPALACGQMMTFYLSAEESIAGRLYDPDPGSPRTAYPADSIVTVFEDDFETDKGWSVSGGAWTRGIPTGGGGENQTYNGEDPTEGCVGSMVFGYNLDGDYTNNMPEYYLTSPPIDCGNLAHVRLHYWRWLGVDKPQFDHASIKVSTDGTTWTPVWENGCVISDNEWVEQELDLSAVADSQPTVYLRWTMGASDAGMTFCGWNIDGVEVTGAECLPLYACGDANGDDIVNVGDIVYVINFVFKSGLAPDPEEAGDANGDGVLNVGDAVYLVNFVFKGGGDPVCP